MKNKFNIDYDVIEEADEYFEKKDDTCQVETDEYFPIENSKPPHY